MSWHSVGHMVAGTVTFVSLIAACYVLARHFARTGHRAWSIAGFVAGTALLLGDGYAMSGSYAGSPALAVGAIAALVYVAAVCRHHR
jgi:hypothetical protein